MKQPGQYTGADGREYRVEGLRVWTNDGQTCRLIEAGSGDITAAKAALDELIESEAGEWVEIDTSWAIKVVGADRRMSLWTRQDDTWRRATIDDTDGATGTLLIFTAFRKGREVTQREERAKVKALVDAIEELSPIIQAVSRGSEGIHQVIEKMPLEQYKRMWPASELVLKLAKAVQS